MTKVLLCNGAPVKQDPELFTINHLGHGAFETFLVKELRQGRGVLGLGLHFKRLDEGCKVLGLSCRPNDEFRAALKAAIELAPPGDLRGRIIILEDKWFLQLEPYSAPKDALKLKTLKLERPLPHIKSCSAIVSVYANKNAVEAGFDEALLLSKSGAVREGSWSNFFMAGADGVIRTPADGVLNGVTREIVLSLANDFEVRTEDFQFETLRNAKFCFTTRSTAGIQEVLQVDEIIFSAAPEVSALRSAYQALYSSDSPLLEIY